jgi:hypothetical protein
MSLWRYLGLGILALKLEPRAEFFTHKLQSNIVKLCTGSIQSVEEIPISRPPRSSLPVVEQELNQA